MKTKKFFIRSASLKLLLAVPLAIFVLAAVSISASAQESTNKTEIAPPPPPPPPPPPAQGMGSYQGVMEGRAYKKVDEMPVFRGGDSALLKFVAENTIYPKDAKEKGIQGQVYARFMINTDGTVSDISIVKSADPSLDAEALRVISMLPGFIPGKLNGVVVPVWYIMPISFKLK
jgi:TonB family protein